MSIIQGTAKGGSTSFYDYPIGDSLRFDGSSYLSRTPTTTTNSSRTTWTWSGWVKRSALSSRQCIFGLTPGAANATNFFIEFQANDTLAIDAFTFLWRATTQVFRDSSAFYHVICAVDTTQALANNRIRLSVNGTEITSLSTINNPSQNDELGVNQASTHYIGSVDSSLYLDGYMANIQFIDGQALDASYFGETKGDIWIPKRFDGTSSTGGSTVSTDYGTNGFLLDFSSISGTTINDTAPIDTNHSSANNWTATGF
jgi:hypothetical protein